MAKKANNVATKTTHNGHIPVQGLRSTWKGMSVGFLPLTTEIVIALLNEDRNNRTIGWRQVVTLATSMREGRFVWAAAMQSRSWENSFTDGRHRKLAFIVCYGSDAEVQWLNTTFNGGVEKLPPAVAKFRSQQQKPPAIPEDAAIVLVDGITPEAFQVQDQDQKKRTGADMLSHDSVISNAMDNLGVTPSETQNILRFVYLRANPGKNYAEPEKQKFGSLSKGGNISPQRYKDYWKTYGKTVERAAGLLDLTYIPDSPRGWDATQFSTAKVHAIAASTLYLLSSPTDEEAEEAIVILGDSLTRMKRIGSEVVADPMGVGRWIRKHQEGLKLHSTVIFSGIVAQLLDPKRVELDSLAWDRLMGVGRKDYNPEQDAAFRCAGPDSTKG